MHSPARHVILSFVMEQRLIPSFQPSLKGRVCQGLQELPITGNREDDVAPSNDSSHPYIRQPLDPKINPPISALAPFVLHA